jgi:catecholate siderophore receptor
MTDRHNSAPATAENAPRSSTSLTPAAIAALVNSLMLASTATAQSGDSARQDSVSLDKLTVEEAKAKPLSSPKFNAPLVDTPQTIVVVPSLVIEQQGAQTLSDVLRNTPGITFTAGEGGNVASGDTFTMRGFDTSGSIFIDGVRDTGAYSRDTFNLEQVEIAKGPAGADNGRGGASGYVNLVTKTPDQDTFINGTASYASAEQMRATLDINQTVANSPVEGTAVRFNAMWRDGETPGRDYVENSSWGFSPSLALGLGTPTRISISGTVIEQDNLPDSGLPVVAVPGGPILPPGVAPLTEPVSQENFYGLADTDFEKIEHQRVIARLEHDFSPDLKLTQQFVAAGTDRDARTTFIANSSTTYYNPATRVITPRSLRSQTHNEIYHSLTHLAVKFSTAGFAHDLGTGMELSREKQRTPTWVVVNAPSTSLYAPNAHRPSSAAQFAYRDGNGAQATAQNDTAAFYVFDTVKLAPKWLLNASGRFDHYKIDYASIANTGVLTELGKNDDLFSWKTGLVFKPVPAGSLYAAYGNTLTPSGSGFALSATANNQNNPNLDAQEARNLELGVKWEFFKSRLSTSLALFSSENLNVVSTDALTGLVTQDISQKVEGVEFGVSGKISPEWLVFGGVSFMESENEASGTTSAANDGASLRYTPEVSGSLWTTYILPIGLTVGGGVQYSDSVSRSTANSVAITSPVLVNIPSYTVFNAMAEYALTKNISLRLNLNNVADEEYIRVNNNGGRYYPGTARSWQLTAIAKF